MAVTTATPLGVAMPWICALAELLLSELELLMELLTPLPETILLVLLVSLAVEPPLQAEMLMVEAAMHIAAIILAACLIRTSGPGLEDVLDIDALRVLIAKH